MAAGFRATMSHGETFDVPADLYADALAHRVWYIITPGGVRLELDPRGKMYGYKGTNNSMGSVVTESAPRIPVDVITNPAHGDGYRN